MFYNYLFLGKHGTLSKIWIAAHWEKKLTKAHVFECNLESAIQSIMVPKVSIALRTSGHLLFGIVRIYHRKAKYLLADCNEAILNMKTTFRAGPLDLSENKMEASYKAITLPEDFTDFDIQFPDINLIDGDDNFTLNQSRMEDITIREAYYRHDGFGDDIDPFRHFSASDVSFEVSATANSVLAESSVLLPGDTKDFFANDSFGDEGATTDFFDDNQLFNEFYIQSANKDVCQDVMLPPEDQPPEAYTDETQESPLEDVPVANTTTLVSDEELGFVLEPIDVSVLEKKKRRKRKRTIMVDDLKEIPSSRMKEQLKNTSDIVKTLNIAPTPLQLIKQKGVQRLLSLPSQLIISTELLQLYPGMEKDGPLRHMQKKTAEPAKKTVRREQDIDLPQMEVTKPTDVSSSIAEDPIHTTAGLNDHHQVTSDMNQEEYADGLLGCLDEEVREMPQSVQSNEEQQRNKRTENLLNGLRKLNQSGVSSFSLQNLCKNNKRKQVSTKFHSLLLLNKQAAITMTQSTPFGDITVTPGPSFHTL